MGPSLNNESIYNLLKSTNYIHIQTIPMTKTENLGRADCVRIQSIQTLPVLSSSGALQFSSGELRSHFSQVNVFLLVVTKAIVLRPKK